MGFSTCHTNRWDYRRVSCGGWRTNKRLITYEYTANGARYHNQRLLDWGRSIRAGFFDVGQSFPVYFDTNKPDISYAPYPPEKTIFIVSGIMFAVLGVGLILFGWRAPRHAANR